MIPYEILIRGNADGTLSGCHVIDVAGGDARAITPADLEALSPSINAALFAKEAECNAAVKDAADAKESAEIAARNALAERDATRAFAAGIIAKAEAALADNSLSEQERIDLLASCVAEAKKPAEQREREAIAAQIAELQAKLNQ